MKILYFTKEITPNAVDNSTTLGIIGEHDPQSYPQDGIKRVPALKLIKAMKQMTNKADYCVMGDSEYVEAAKKLGFEEYQAPQEKPEEQLEGELTQIAATLIALDKKYRELDAKYGNAKQLQENFKKREEELKQKYEKDLEVERGKMKAEIKKIKKVIKKIIKE